MKNTQANLFSELHQTVLLGIRSIIISHLLTENKEEFENIVRSGTDDDLIFFGYKYIPQFAEKIQTMNNQIQKAYKGYSI